MRASGWSIARATITVTSLVAICGCSSGRGAQANDAASTTTAGSASSSALLHVRAALLNMQTANATFLNARGKADSYALPTGDLRTACENANSRQTELNSAVRALDTAPNPGAPIVEPDFTTVKEWIHLSAQGLPAYGQCAVTEGGITDGD